VSGCFFPEHSVVQRLCCSEMYRYDTIDEFDLDSKAECGQLYLAHVARNKYITIRN